MDLSASPSASRATTARPDICIILNAASGRRKGRDFLATLESALARHPGRFAVERARRGREVPGAIARAVGTGYPVLVAAGGDGTITAVAEAALEHDRTLGVLPFGTFNFVARGLGIPDDIDAAVDLLAEGPERTVSLAEVNGRAFLNNASLGLYPAILREREGIYRRWGRSQFAAHWSVVRTVMGLVRPLPLRVTVDGTTIRTRTPLLFVARSAFQMEHYGIEGAEEVRRDRFVLFLAPDATRVTLLRIAARLALGRLRIGQDVEQVVGEEIVVDTPERRPTVARDGERTKLEAPLVFRVRSDALRIVAPGDAPG